MTTGADAEAIDEGADATNAAEEVADAVEGIKISKALLSLLRHLACQLSLSLAFLRHAPQFHSSQPFLP